MAGRHVALAYMLCYDSPMDVGVSRLTMMASKHTEEAIPSPLSGVVYCKDTITELISVLSRPRLDVYRLFHALLFSREAWFLTSMLFVQQPAPLMLSSTFFGLSN